MKGREEFRLHHLNELNQANEVVPRLHHGHRGRVKVCRPRRSTAAKAVRNPGSDPQNPVQPVVKPEERKLHRRQLCRVRRRNQNMVARQHDDHAASPARGKVNPNGIRHRSAYGSARRRLWPQVNMGNAAEVNHLDFVNRSLRRLVDDRQIKRAVKKKKCRAFTLSRHRHRNEAAPLPKPSMARHRDNPKVERKNRRKKHHRQDHNRCSVIIAAAPD